MRKLLFFSLIFAILMVPSTAFAKKRIEINIPSRTLKLYDDSRFIKMYPIAVGKPSSDSPTGHFRVISKQVNPTWRPKGKKPVPPGPANPLGTRWIGFFSDYGIHGNNDPKSIGTFASKGCVRMQIYDVEELFDLIGIGTDVDIYYTTMYPYAYDDNSLNTLIIYPDLYNKKVNQLWKVDDQLDKLNILNGIDWEKKQNLYKSVNNKTVAFSQNWILFTNNQFVTSDTRLRTSENPEELAKLPAAEKVLVNIKDINAYFGTNLKIDEQNELKFDKWPMYYEKAGENVYVSIPDLIRNIEGYFETDVAQEKINWIISYGSLDGRLIRLDIKQVGHAIYVSAKDIANALGYEPYWDDQKQALIANGQEIRGKIIGERMYLTRAQVGQYFGLRTNYFSILKKMELYSSK